MNYQRLLFAATGLGLALPGIAQSPNLAPLPMDPPAGILGTMPTGGLPSAQVLHLGVCLPYGNPDGMQQFVDSVSDPKSPQYRQFLTPSQVGARFGLPVSAVQKVVGYLKSNGMTIRLVAANRLTILADATVAQANAAFHTSVESFLALSLSDLGGATHFAFTATPSVPTDISPYIVHVSGLENFSHAVPMGNYPLAPAQLRSLYNVAPLYSGSDQGAGRTIGISNYDGFRLANLTGWYSNSSWTLPTPSGGIGSNVTDEVPSGDTSGAAGTASGEGDLDIQSVLAAAPLASVIIYDGGSASTDLIGVLTLEANDNKADIITESYGWNGSASLYTSAHNLHLSMSAQGITYICASGDHGTNCLLSTSSYYCPYPDDDPEVLVVGGTTTPTASSGGAVSSQTGWGYVTSGVQIGSGGGWAVTTDSFNTLPSWQVGTGVPTGVNYKLVPDVALNADPNTSYYIYLQSGELGETSAGLYSGIGGTSAASPTFAGSLADAEEAIIATGGLPTNSAGKQRYGRIAPLLYSFNGSSAIFTDITSGTNGTLPNGSTSSCTTGWDPVTGWGCMNFDGFVVAEAGAINVKTVSVSAPSVEGGGSTAATGTVTLTAAAPTGGTKVTLTSSSTSATVPASVTVAAGATTATFTVTTTIVASSTTSTIGATIGAGTASTTLTITTPKVTAVALSPTTVVGGKTSTGTVTIDLAAPSAGLVVTLTSSITATATVPASVTIASGKTSATFTVTSLVVAATSSPSISATSGGATSSATLTVSVATPSSVTASSSSVNGGTSLTGTVTLTGAAPTGGLAVALSVSSTTGATVPASVTVASGSSTATFTITTLAVNSSTAETLTAKAGGASVTTTFTVNAATISTMTASATAVVGGVTNETITATLGSTAGPAGVTVALTATPTTAATLGASSITIAAGKTSGTVTVTSLAVAANTAVTVTGTLAGASKSVTFTDDAATVSSVTVSPATVVGGSATVVTVTVTLTGPAGPSAETVTLSSSNSTAAPIPASVSVAAGSKTASVTFTTKAVTANATVTLKATLGSSSASSTLTVQT